MQHLHLAAVETLNGSVVSSRERLVAERFFLEYLTKDFIAAKRENRQAEFYEQQPEFKRLVERERKLEWG